MKEVTIRLPTLSGYKTHLAGLALVFAGLSELSNDAGKDLIDLTDWVAVFTHTGTQKVFEGAGLMALRDAIRHILKARAETTSQQPPKEPQP